MEVEGVVERLSREVARKRAISRAAGLLVDASLSRCCSSSDSGNMKAPPSTGVPPIAASLSMVKHNLSPSSFIRITVLAICADCDR